MERINNCGVQSSKILYPSYNAVQINLAKPTANVSAPVIYDYPEADKPIYYTPLAPISFGTKTHIERTPSGVNDYENLSEIDKYGQEITSVKYSKNGDALVQELKTISPDGTKLEKILTNSPNSKTLNLVIKDASGNILLTKEKSYTKLDENNAQSIVNGKVYNISGLKGDILTVEHNGEKISIDLNKMLNPNVKLLKDNTNPDNYEIRNTQITAKEKEKLFNRIKSLGGDDLVKLSKCTDRIQFLDNTKFDGHFIAKDKTLLLSGKDWEDSHTITEHELGHAINNSNLANLISDNPSFINIRNYEKTNYLNNRTPSDNDKMFNSKFIEGNSELNWDDSDNDSNNDPDSYLRDETFAESFNNLNTMDIIHYDDEGFVTRILSLFKYMPRTMAEVEKLSQI